MTQTRPSRFNKKAISLGTSLFVFIGLITIVSIILWNYSGQLREEREYEVSLVYHNLIGEIQDFTNQNVSLLSGFAAYVKMNDIHSDEEIYTYLDNLLKDHLDDIRSIGVFQDTTIQWVYPLEGNESVIGVDFSKVPGQAEEIKRVKENLETLFVGPINLVQGGEGFIIRMPLTKNDKYWGMVSIVLRAEQAFGFIDEHSDFYKVDYLLTHDGDTENVIYGDTKVLDMEPLKFRTKESLGGWDVYAVPRGGWKSYKFVSWSIFAMSFLVSLALSRYVYRSLMNYNRIVNDKIELEKKYILDRFTGIYTREYFNLRVQEEFSQAQRHKYSISMIYFDIDHFKKVNDNHGHATGDKVLLQVVSVVKSIIRTEDVFSRWGGDEFILLLPHTELKEAQVIAERIRQEVEGLEISKSLGVTASVGCSQWVVSEYLESWFARTDKALYVSKNTGKNKITVSDSETEKDVFVKVYWSDSWNSGHPAIDAEHKNLLERCNSIIESSLGHSTYDETLRNVDVFLADMKKHFSNEIDILRERNYPEVDKHEVIHENLLNKAHELCSKAVNDDVTTGELFTFLLLTVMKYHINGEDINYFDYL